MAPEEPLYREFGVDAEILIDHAWGVEPVRMEHIKAYRSQSHSVSNAQVLACDYSFDDALIVAKEMAEAETPLSIGAVKPGSRIFLMDESYTLPGLPEGEKGEIVIAGDTVAKGYLNRPELTAEKFITLRTPEGEMRAYKTGDEGYLRDGLLYYSGRMDFQLKINGYRIELGDIENNLLLLDNVKACVCLPIEKKGVNRGLAAFVCTEAPAEDEFAAAQTLRQQLMERLPAYMVPKKFVFLEDMPKTNNGKVDRRALKERL